MVKLHSNDNTYALGQEWIFLFQVAIPCDPLSSFLLHGVSLISVEHTSSSVDRASSTAFIYIVSVCMFLIFFPGEINILDKHQNIIAKLIPCVLPLLFESLYIQGFLNVDIC